MAYDRNNVFARILRGESPSVKVFEDRHTLALLDIMPEADGHTLVLPKEAAATLLELSEASAQACILTIRRVAGAIQRAFGAPGLAIYQLNGEVAGQSVGHVHFHIIPRFPGLTLKAHARERGDPDRLDQIAARIIAEIDAGGV